jgi:ATP-dependent Lhr-like helicase
MRQIVQRGSPSPAPDRKPFSSLEADLAGRLESRRPQAAGVGRRPAESEYRAAKRRVRERLARPVESTWVGRWSPVHRFGVMGKALPPEQRAGQQARQLLSRYGVVTYESLSNETGAWEWSQIYPHLQRLEMRGELRRGYFVQGLPGPQFALPEVVERLRASRDQADAGLVVLNAADPANLYGPALPEGPVAATGEPLSFSRIPSTWLVQQAGLPVLVAEDTGGAITTLQGADETLLRQAIAALLDHLARFESRLTVYTWNGEPVLESPGRAVLEAAGFYRNYPGMTWERPAWGS